MTGRHHVESMWGREFAVRYVAAWDEFGRWYRGAVTAQRIGLTMPYRPLDRPVRHEHGVSGVTGADSRPHCGQHAVWLVDHGDKWVCERCGEKVDS